MKKLLMKFLRWKSFKLMFIMSVATSTEPRNRKEIALRKFNCLNEVSFEFLGIYLLFIGNPTKSGSKPLQELCLLFGDAKSKREVLKITRYLSQQLF